MINDDPPFFHIHLANMAVGQMGQSPVPLAVHIQKMIKLVSMLGMFIHPFLVIYGYQLGRESWYTGIPILAGDYP